MRRRFPPYWKNVDFRAFEPFFSSFHTIYLTIKQFFVRDGILSIADYNLSRMVVGLVGVVVGVVGVVVVVATFRDWIT